jgi:hypothetical protein
MTEKVKVPGNKRDAEAYYTMVGLVTAREALGGDKPKCTLPGFAMAIALVEKEVAEQRARSCASAYRAAARAGFDVSKVSQIHTLVIDGDVGFEVTEGDLIDLAAAGE